MTLGLTQKWTESEHLQLEIRELFIASDDARICRRSGLTSSLYWGLRIPKSSQVVNYFETNCWLSVAADSTYVFKLKQNPVEGCGPAESVEGYWKGLENKKETSELCLQRDVTGIGRQEFFMWKCMWQNIDICVPLVLFRSSCKCFSPKSLYFKCLAREI